MLTMIWTNYFTRLIQFLKAVLAKDILASFQRYAGRDLEPICGTHYYVKICARIEKLQLDSLVGRLKACVKLSLEVSGRTLSGKNLG